MANKKTESCFKAFFLEFHKTHYLLVQLVSVILRNVNVITSLFEPLEVIVVEDSKKATVNVEFCWPSVVWLSRWQNSLQSVLISTKILKRNFKKITIKISKKYLKCMQKIF